MNERKESWWVKRAMNIINSTRRDTAQTNALRKKRPYISRISYPRPWTELMYASCHLARVSHCICVQSALKEGALCRNKLHCGWKYTTANPYYRRSQACTVAGGGKGRETFDPWFSHAPVTAVWNIWRRGRDRKVTVTRTVRVSAWLYSSNKSSLLAPSRQVTQRAKGGEGMGVTVTTNAQDGRTVPG